MKAGRCLEIWAVTLLIVAAPALALDIGEPAPPLNVAEWVKGQPVALEEGKGKQVYVIEFWESRSPYSRDCIADLTRLQKKHANNVVIVAITGEQPEEVKQFMAAKGAEIGYRVAIDKEQETLKAYLIGLGVGTIPHAFVVDKSGALVWHGHPLVGLEKTLEAILGGTYDSSLARSAQEARKMMPQYFRMACMPGRLDQADKLGEQILAKGRSDAWLMNEFAWEIVSKPGLVTRNLELALRAAQAAYDGCDGKHAGIVDTYARVLFESGKKEQALKYQQQAVELGQGSESQPELKEHLEIYERALNKQPQKQTRDK